MPEAIRHPRHGAPAMVWRYLDPAGALLFAVARFDKPDGGKEVLPYGCGADGWRWKAPPDPRPLYGLDRLAARPNAPVLLVEGEKAADAAAELFPHHVAMTWQGGSNATSKADWLALAGRSVAVWPDNDAPGRKAAAAVAKAASVAGAARVVVVQIPAEWPDGWDVADPLPEGTAPDILAQLLNEAGEAEAGEAEPDTGDKGAMPPGFYVRRAGVFLRNDDPEKPDLHVCGPLRIVAATHDGNGEDWGALLSWEDKDGRPHEWAMPLALLAGDGSAARERLLRGGLFVATGRGAREALARYLMCANPKARVRIVSRIGWHDTPAGRVFVLPDGAIGAADTGRVMLQTERPDALPPLAQSGSLEEWQREVAGPCAGNSRLVLALSAAFAAPLLALLGAEGGGIHFRGPSSAGKTTALTVAGSVWGGGGLNGWARRWRATDNALEAVAVAHCDLLLCLDEMGEAAPEAVAAAAYMLANGGGKGRAARDGGARRTAEWRLLFLSTGEVGLAERLAETRGGPRRPMAGQAVRVVDVPAEAGAGLGLFDVLHDAPDGATFAKRLSYAARRLYGTAGRTFLERLAAEADPLAAAAAEVRRDFLARHVAKDVAGQVARVADRFALLAAAGEMAAAVGVLPFAKGEAEKAAARCFAAWRGTREGGDGSAEDAAAIAAVRHFIGANAARFERLNPPDGGEPRAVPNRAGWLNRDDAGELFFILPETWKREVVAGLDPQAAARALRRAGYLWPQSESATAHTRVARVGLSKPARVYAVRDSILAGDPEPEGGA